MATLAEAALSAGERRVLDRFVERLGEELGDELRGVWLYGSRARGESTGWESDVDLLVITATGREGDRVSRGLHEAAEAEVASPFFFSVHVHGLDWLAERRAIEAFFVREVDRDRIVLAGDPDGLPGVRSPVPELLPGEMRPRSRELLEEALERLGAARSAVRDGFGTPVVSLAYYAAFNAAHAALSEEDRFARRHGGTWHLFHDTFVATGRFDEGLYAETHAVLEKRVEADYKPVRFSAEEARVIFETCDRFVVAVEAMLGA